MNTKILSAAIAFLGTALGAALPAQAATTGSDYYLNPAQACQLSIPTIDTAVAPRANGFRNPGTADAFVICGFNKMNSLRLGNAAIYSISMDGQAHDISCTGVNGLANVFTQTYVSKVSTVPATGYVSAAFMPADFGDTTTIPGTENTFSITCNLPSQVAIIALTAAYTYEIGA